MRHDSATLATLACALAACAAPAAKPAQALDAGDPPPGAYAECDPAGQHDAASFLFTATCSLPPGPGDAGVPGSCADWSESADGDWTPFVASCLDGGGTITTVPCDPSGVTGVCTFPPSCTDQTTAFYYGAAQATSGKAACAASPGATFSLSPQP